MTGEPPPKPPPEPPANVTLPKGVRDQFPCHSGVKSSDLGWQHLLSLHLFTFLEQRRHSSVQQQFAVMHKDGFPVYEQYLTLKKALATEPGATKTLSLIIETLVLTGRLTHCGCRVLVSARTHERLDRWA